jgi:hypothetical protein
MQNYIKKTVNQQLDMLPIRFNTAFLQSKSNEKSIDYQFFKGQWHVRLNKREKVANEVKRQLEKETYAP